MSRKEVWKTYPQIWKTKAQYFTWLRGGLRKLWSDYPARKEWKRGQLRKVTPEERATRVFHPSTKNVGQCVFCKEWMAGSKLECDHLHSSQGCYDFETAQEFLWYCTNLEGNDFQLACKPCHKIESYREKMGISFEEARVTKQAITWQKERNPEGEIEELMEYGYTKEECSNGPKRRALYIQHLLKEEKNDS
jgi:hypothetical protein